jgi:hypothetical protein
MSGSSARQPRYDLEATDNREADVRAATILGVAAAAACLGGCVQLKAPDKPIEINLNVNIRQEVVVRLEKDVKDLIAKNPGVF